MRKFFVFIYCLFTVGMVFGAGENVPTSKSYIDSALTQKQDTIERATGANQVLTNTGVAGEYGTKNIYDSTAAYAGQTDALIDAITMNTGVQNAINTEFECISWVDDDPTKDCLLMEIRGKTTAQQPYVSATGTVVQDGTPMPNNPIDPVFYTRGNMTLRRVGDYADSYDATTHKITRRVGIKVLDGTEIFYKSLAGANNVALYYTTINTVALNERDDMILCSHFLGKPAYTLFNILNIGECKRAAESRNFYFATDETLYPTVENFKSYLAAQYAAGTPVVIYYPLATPVVENWPETTYNQYMPVGN